MRLLKGMQQRLKERLVGASVLVIIAVIFIPMILTGPVETGSITKTNIPARPEDEFNSKLIPLNDTLEPVQSISTEEQPMENVGQEETTSISIESSEEEPDKSSPEQSDVAKQQNVKSEKKSSDKQVGLSAWVVQLGSFSSKVNADKLNLQLRKSGFPAFVEPIKQKNETAYRVRVGPELLRSDADALLKQIKTKMKLDGIVLQYP